MDYSFKYDPAPQPEYQYEFTYSYEDSQIELSWRAINRIVDAIEEQVKDKGYTAVVGLARGGVVPAVMLSHRLGIKFESVAWQTRDGGFQEIGRLNNIVSREKVLIVDDICDSGLTLTQVKANHPDADVAVLVTKTETKLVDFVGETYYNDNRWVVFPWE